MTIRLITEGATATAIYEANAAVRRAIIDKRTLTLDDLIPLLSDPKTRTFAKLAIQMLSNDPAGAASVNISIMRDRIDLSETEDILDDIINDQEEKPMKEEEPDYTDVIDPDTENFC